MVETQRAETFAAAAFADAITGPHEARRFLGFVARQNLNHSEG